MKGYEILRDIEVAIIYLDAVRADMRFINIGTGFMIEKPSE